MRRLPRGIGSPVVCALETQRRSTTLFTGFDKYSKPINTPVANMRPANETCEQCHWPSKFCGPELKTFNHHRYDEQNSLRHVYSLAVLSLSQSSDRSLSHQVGEVAWLEKDPAG